MGLSELDKPRFLGVKRQTKFGHSLLENLRYTQGIFLTFETDHKVIGKTPQLCLASHAWSNVLFEPRIESVMEIDITQEGGKGRTLNCPNIGLIVFLAVENPNMKAFTNKSHKRRVGNAGLQHLLQLRALDAVEVILEICLQDPFHFSVVYRFAKTAECIVGFAIRSKAL